MKAFVKRHTPSVILMLALLAEVMIGLWVSK
jgi:hypothetical protein